MKTLRFIIQMVGWVMFLLANLVQLMCWAAEGDIEYRFERMVPQIQKSFQFVSNIEVAPDGSLWMIYDGSMIQGAYTSRHLQHINTDGSMINDLANIALSDVAFGEDGSIWASISDSNQIQHLNIDGTHIGAFGNSGSSLGQFNNPGAIAIAADGSVWVSDRGNNRIQHLTANGEFLAMFGGSENKDIQFNNPQDIAVEKDGSIWIADNAFIYHLKANGTLITKFARTRQTSDLFTFTHIALALDGSLWVAEAGDKFIQHLNSDGSLIVQFGIYGSIGEFSSLSGLAVTADGSLWVVNEGLLQHLNSDGSLIVQFGESIFDNTLYLSKRIINVAMDNSVWLNVWNNENKLLIQHLNKDGTLIEQFDHEDARILQLGTNGSVWKVLEDGSLWGLDSNTFLIKHISKSGDLITQIGGAGLGNGQFSSIGDIAFGPDGSVWVLEFSFFSRPSPLDPNPVYNSGRNSVQHFTVDGRFIAKYDLPSRGNTIDIASDGSVWLIVSGSIYHANADGTLIGQIGSEGSDLKQFSYPSGIAFALDGSLWIADGGNKRIQHLTVDGNFIEQIGIVSPESEVFEGPTDISIGANDAMWVSVRNFPSQNTCLQKFVPRFKGVTAHPYKAIVLAGRAESVSSEINDLWSWQTAQNANLAFQLQGYKNHEEINFLTAGNTQIDLDENNQMDDLQAATKDSLRLAITDWAKDSSDVVFYLAGVSTAGQFQINSTESVSFDEIAAWLNELEKIIPGKVTVVIESNDAGSFLKTLASKNRPRIIITSTEANQTTILADHGVNSFSYSFWSKVKNGASIKDAFASAHQDMGALLTSHKQAQNALLDANGDAQSTTQDLSLLGDYCLGNCNKTVVNPPMINPLSQTTIALSNTTSLDFTIMVQHSENLLEAWALVQRPDQVNNDPNQAVNIEKIQLTCDAQAQCGGRYYRFDAHGEYRINFYALDDQYQLSAPMTLIVNQPQTQAVMPVEYDDRKALVYFYDVEVNGEHYQATLKAQGGLYHLETFSLAPYTFNPAARFDATTNLISIPLARVYGQAYQGSFKLVGNSQFQLLTATPK